MRQRDATILVIDDEPGIVRLLQTVLDNEGYTVLGTGNGAEALELIQKQSIDLIILDLLMPDLSGWDLLEALERLEQRPPVAVVSAVFRGEAIERATERFQASAYLTKPFRVDELVATIERILAEPASR